MRPVFRGDVPTDGQGKPVCFKKYGDARNALIGRIGDYCCYCESPIQNPAVEHIQPKSHEPALEKTWSNFLLACPICNSIKNDQPINAANLSDYFWADTDNTLRGFFYEKDRAPQVHASLTVAHQHIARNTLALTGLDREPSHPLLTKKDRRWEKRREAWAKAERAKFNLSRQSSGPMREQIIDTAVSTGFWSIWMTVFHDDPDMRQRFIKAFTGTSEDCFDRRTQPVARPGGKL
ncbi:HNH endonuclease [Methylovulum psychrotolerans]|uniref:HNH endonuclease n=1 Tax=Methylovulum psychrotolerans TaxID=1704499 RepID=UPI001BFF7055|nr:HNH endonuclease [Methylovulum psychrotolerans]MBT9098119.1 HNH endonuclease [Methylovulum psychrotolerans]